MNEIPLFLAQHDTCDNRAYVDDGLKPLDVYMMVEIVMTMTRASI